MWQSSTGEGHTHDKKIYNEDPFSLTKGIGLWRDTGSQGYTPDGVDVCMPKKKPKGELRFEEKQDNKRIS